MNERLRAILSTYINEASDEHGSIRYIIALRYDHNSDIPLQIRYVDNGGNYHSLGWTERGMVTFER